MKVAWLFGAPEKQHFTNTLKQTFVYTLYITEFISQAECKVTPLYSFLACTIEMLWLFNKTKYQENKQNTLSQHFNGCSFLQQRYTMVLSHRFGLSFVFCPSFTAMVLMSPLKLILMVCYLYSSPIYLSYQQLALTIMASVSYSSMVIELRFSSYEFLI